MKRRISFILAVCLLFTGMSFSVRAYVPTFGDTNAQYIPTFEVIVGDTNSQTQEILRVSSINSQNCLHERTIMYISSEDEQLDSNYHRHITSWKGSCMDCGAVLVQMEEIAEEQHRYLDNSNVCGYCGYEKQSASTNNTTYIPTFGDTDSNVYCLHKRTEIYSSTEYEQLNSTYHRYIETYEEICKDCGADVDEWEEVTKEEHYYKNNSSICYYCGYKKQSTSTSTTNQSNTTKLQIVFKVGEKAIYIAGEKVTLDTATKDVNGTTYIPAKALTIALKGRLDGWDANSLAATFTLGTYKVIFYGNTKKCSLNGVSKTLSSTVLLSNEGVMYVSAKDYFGILDQTVNYKDGYCVVSDGWLSQEEIQSIIGNDGGSTNNNGTTKPTETPSTNNYIAEMKAGKLYAVGDGGHLYRRNYSDTEAIGYKDNYVYTLKTPYDELSISVGTLLIESKDLLYDTNGKVVCASISILLKCDQRISELMGTIYTGAGNAYNNDTISKARRDEIKSSVSSKVEQYMRIKRVNGTLSNIPEQKASYVAKTGDSGSKVTEIQESLYKLGFTSQFVTGYYGDITFNNIAYQKQAN